MSSVKPESIMKTDEDKATRRNPTEKNVATQFKRLANIAQGVKSKPVRRRLGGVGVVPHLPDYTVTLLPPYVSGEPNPEYRFNSTTGQIQNTGINGLSEFAWGDPNLGRFSLGAQGGKLFKCSALTPLTGQWFLGDATAVSASLFASKTVKTVSPTRKATELVCVVELSNQEVLAHLAFDGCAKCWPGTSGSALGGFVAVSGALDVTVTLVSPQRQFLASNTSSTIFLELAVNAKNPGLFNGVILDPSLFLALNWLFDSAPNRIVQGVVTIPLNVPEDHLVTTPTVIVEATVRMVGARGGTNDPDAGYFFFDFSDGDNNGDGFAQDENFFFSVPRIIVTPIY